ARLFTGVSDASTMAPERRASSWPFDPVRATSVTRSPGKLGPLNTRCGIVRPVAAEARIAGQSGVSPDVVPVIEIIVQIWWEIDRIITPFRKSVRAPLAWRYAVTDGRSGWSTNVSPPTVMSSPSGSMSTFVFENSVANTRVGSQPPCANTKMNFRSAALTAARASGEYGSDSPAAPAAVVWRNVLRFMVAP